MASIYENIEKHDTLNPKLWTSDNKLKEEVSTKIKLIVYNFIENLVEDKIKFNLLDIVLIGSNCSYNYTKNSDLDVHLIASTHGLECPENLYNLLYSSYRSIFNKNHNINFYDIPVEIYVELDGAPRISNGAYSVLNNKWLSEPKQEAIPSIDIAEFNKEFKIWEDRYAAVLKYANNELGNISLEESRLTREQMIRELEWIYHKHYNWYKYTDAQIYSMYNKIASSKQTNNKNNNLDENLKNKTLQSIDKYISDIYDLRKTALAQDGEYSIGNLIFKEIRNKGYLDNLKEIKNKLVDKELSLEDLQEGGVSKLPERLRRDYANELSKLSYNRAILQDNGMFNIYNVKEDDVDRIVRLIRNLDYIDWVQTSTGQYDFSSFNFSTGYPKPKKFWRIYGQVKL